MNATPIVVRSFAKINLALAVLGKRPDGYHEIRTVFQSIDLHDELEIRPSGELSLRCVGLPDVPKEENTVWRAASALVRAVPPPHGAEIILRKRIPAGAGLGGGSSNAAAALMGLCRFWDLKVPAAELSALAASVGSDVPFFLQGGTALGIGRGEEVYPLPEIRGWPLVVIYPGVRVSTSEAYRSLSSSLTSGQAIHKMYGFCTRLEAQADWPGGIFNDFETSILPAFPAIREARDFLRERGASAVHLSGSGSSVFGFFPEEESALAAARGGLPEEGWRAFPAKTLSRAEYLQGIFGVSPANLD